MNRTQTLDHRFAAPRAACRAAIDLEPNSGGRIVRRRVSPNAQSTFGVIELLAGRRTVRQIELGCRHAARDHIREAREAGDNWHQIGQFLGLTPDADPDQEGTAFATAAYTYPARNPGTETALRHGRSSGWTCRLRNTISDRCIVNCHAVGCRCLAGAIAACDAEREASQ